MTHTLYYSCEQVSFGIQFKNKFQNSRVIAQGEESRASISTQAPEHQREKEMTAADDELMTSRLLAGSGCTQRWGDVLQFRDIHAARSKVAERFYAKQCSDSRIYPFSVAQFCLTALSDEFRLVCFFQLHSRPRKICLQICIRGLCLSFETYYLEHIHTDTCVCRNLEIDRTYGNLPVSILSEKQA